MSNTLFLHNASHSGVKTSRAHTQNNDSRILPSRKRFCITLFIPKLVLLPYILHLYDHILTIQYSITVLHDAPSICHEALVHDV